ncbi:MAG: hypothetical protein HYZ34_10795 [Ignavibacteriae bacterium]|nr:hypothetical protein [Ignavibacteriota bacterium]
MEEIVFGGENNGLQRAILVVLDHRAITGYSPTDDEHRPQGKLLGTEKFYIVFPRSDLARFSRVQRNRTNDLRLVENGIEIHIVESLHDDTQYGPIFQFDNALRCIGITEEDLFATYHHKLETEGKLTKKLDAQYYEDLRQGVQYWDGDKFVKEPTMNKRYIEAIRSSESSDSQDSQAVR